MTVPHWLRTGGATTTPDIVVSFDTETTWETTLTGETHTLRCWDAVVRHRHLPEGTRKQRSWHCGEHALDLAILLDELATGHAEVWCFAHNLGFDLTVTQLPVMLAALDWQPKFIHLGDESVIFSLEKDKASLVLTDSWSWVRCSLAAAGKDIRMRKVRLPDNDDSLEAWHVRCRHDVEILDRTMATIMDWWEAEALGRFGVTGASCGWRAMRSKIEPKAILVGPEEDRTDFEREAIHGGRREVYRVGMFTGSWIADYDLANAYLTTAGGYNLPVKPYRGADAADIDPLSPPDGTLDVIAEVEITTDRPVAPVRIDGENWWPTGTFRTVLTGPEIRYVAEHAQVTFTGRRQAYRLAPTLADWSTWATMLLASVDGSTPPIVKRMVKGWGRSVVGRFALRTSRLVGVHESTHSGWWCESGHDLDTGHPIERIDYGGTELVYQRDVDGQDISPAVLAFVEGYVRVALARILDAREPSRLLQCNTDGWWEQRADATRHAQAFRGPAPYTVVRKALARELTIIGPNHVATPTDRKWAGIPKDAEQAVDGRHGWLDWPGMRWQMENSQPGQYKRPSRAVELDEHYAKRWVLANNETLPVTTRVQGDGTTVIEPWSATLGRWQEDRLADHQVASLRNLVDNAPTILLPPRGSGPRLPGRIGTIRS